MCSVRVNHREHSDSDTPSQLLGGQEEEAGSMFQVEYRVKAGDSEILGWPRKRQRLSRDSQPEQGRVHSYNTTDAAGLKRKTLGPCVVQNWRSDVENKGQKADRDVDRLV